MRYSERGKINSFDAYMAGFAPWITPRQILILESICTKAVEALDGVDKEALLDFNAMLRYEARIKRKKFNLEVLNS